MRIDCDIVEPWWCVNALAIDPRFRGKGRGTSLVSEVASAGKLAGVDLLYGQSVPGAVTFWERLGFILAGDGEAIRTHSAAERSTGDRVNLNLKPGPGDRFFIKYLTETPGSVRSGLLPASRLEST